MTGNEKTALAAFLDTAGDHLAGYRRPREAYAFGDDETAAVPAPAGLTAKAAEVTVAAAGPTAKADGAGARGPVSAGEAADTLEAVAADVARCKRCGLCAARTNTVPGEGVNRPLVMVVGEGPGADEDAQGRPFVGRAGQLLDRMLDSRGKIGLSRSTNCYIANVVKCWPPGNRDPQPDEVAACLPFLVRQITLLEPKIILAAGNTAAKTLLDSTEGITRLRGRFTVFTGTPLMDGEFNIPLLPTFHPSALLRDESLKAPVWEDLKILRQRLAGLDGNYAARMADIPL